MKRIGTGEDSLGLNICLADFRDTLGDISANNPSTLSFFSLPLSFSSYRDGDTSSVAVFALYRADARFLARIFGRFFRFEKSR